MRQLGESQHLRWDRVSVGGKTVAYGVGGPPDGVPVLFLHGWALGSRAYKRPLGRLAGLGARIWAPDLPGLAGSQGLARGSYRLADLAAWADGFCRAVGIDGPVVVAGHSFGGAIAAQFAHDFAGRVDRLVLINSVGSGVWSAGSSARHMRERPLWHWALHFTSDALTDRAGLGTMLAEAVPNFLQRPAAIWRSASAARTADIAVELAALRRLGTPVTVVSSRDLVVPRASFDAVCALLGVEGKVVDGGHSWLLSRPDRFAEVMGPLIAASAFAGRPRLRAVVG